MYLNNTVIRVGKHNGDLNDSRLVSPRAKQRLCPSRLYDTEPFNKLKNYGNALLGMISDANSERVAVTKVSACLLQHTSGG